MVQDDTDEVIALMEHDDERGPLRTCVVTRAKDSPAHLLRFVLDPNGHVVPDIRGKLPGRGVWVGPSAELVRMAVKRQALARSLRGKGEDGAKRKIVTRPDMAAFVDALLEADALQALSLANKAGLVICGFAKVEAAIANESLVGVINAPEGGDDGRRKLGQSLRRRTQADLNRDGGGGNNIAEINIFTSEQLDLALGRSNVIHACLLNKNAAKGFLARAEKLIRYRSVASQSADATSNPDFE